MAAIEIFLNMANPSPPIVGVRSAIEAFHDASLMVS
jgi:hypothetical protein